jgi:5'-deoxynucleotidase
MKTLCTSWVKFLLKLRALNVCFRWNYHPRLRAENVAEHSYWVTVFADHFAEILGLNAVTHEMVLRLALYHDRLEAITGDLPWPVKRGRTWKQVEKDADEELGFKLATYSDEKMRLLIKAADLMAAFVYADEEVKLGNSYFVKIRSELITAIFTVADPKLYEFLHTWGIRKENGSEPIKEMSHL